MRSFGSAIETRVAMMYDDRRSGDCGDGGDGGDGR